MQIDDLYNFARVASPKLSPDGTSVVYQVSKVNAKTNETVTNLYLANTDGSGVPRQLTNSGKRDTNPQFSPDGKFVLFESNRSGSSQLWWMRLDGGEAQQLTTIATEASQPVWSADGNKLAFVSSVFPEFTDGSDEEIAKQNEEKLKSVEESIVKVRTAEHLFYRHWDSYVEGKRQHLFVLQLDVVDGELRAKGLPHDATPGDRDASPTSSTFSSGRDFCFSADGSHLIFTAPPHDPEKVSLEAWSTNYDLCRVAADNVKTNWENLTSSNKAGDSGPQISPDGKHLAWRSQQTPGAEADRWLISTAKISPEGMMQGDIKRWELADDISVGEFTWANNDEVLFTTEWEGRSRIYRQKVTDSGDKGKVAVDEMAGVHDLTVHNDNLLVYTESTLTAPAEVFVKKAYGDVMNLSQANSNLVSSLASIVPEWTKDIPIEGDYKLQMWILKPPSFDPSKKYPTVYMIHGGPQGAWNDAWSYRWNPALWASQGYVVALPNPRGSTGFGQEFTDQISGDWGGKCYRDLMAGADYLESLPYVDKDRIAAAGASFGGYMMNWFAVNTGRFCTLVTHCSVYNFESMWGTTEELWFDEYEHGGTPWERPESYREFSPQAKAGELAKYRTPMLVIHNDQDFRCPIGQGIELFTTLQRLNIPSRFVNFPDEGHWVNKAANGHRWHTEVFQWLDKHCKDAPGR